MYLFWLRRWSIVSFMWFHSEDIGMNVLCEDKEEWDIGMGVWHVRCYDQKGRGQKDVDLKRICQEQDLKGNGGRGDGESLSPRLLLGGKISLHISIANQESEYEFLMMGGCKGVRLLPMILETGSGSVVNNLIMSQLKAHTSSRYMHSAGIRQIHLPAILMRPWQCLH